MAQSYPVNLLLANFKTFQKIETNKLWSITNTWQMLLKDSLSLCWSSLPHTSFIWAYVIPLSNHTHLPLKQTTYDSQLPWLYRPGTAVWTVFLSECVASWETMTSVSGLSHTHAPHCLQPYCFDSDNFINELIGGDQVPLKGGSVDAWLPFTDLDFVQL